MLWECRRVQVLKNERRATLYDKSIAQGHKTVKRARPAMRC
jgi:hypothetical protein